MKTKIFSFGAICKFVKCKKYLQEAEKWLFGRKESSLKREDSETVFLLLSGHLSVKLTYAFSFVWFLKATHFMNENNADTYSH